jgi:uncharacterized OB-fold protein
MDPKITVKDYLAALKENKLLGVKCRECGFITAPPRLACRKCSGQDTELVELSGKGKIATFTSVNVAVESRREKRPYLVVLVALDEGPWIMGNLCGSDPSNSTLDLIDKRVVMRNPVVTGEPEPADGLAPQFYLEG